MLSFVLSPNSETKASGSRAEITNRQIDHQVYTHAAVRLGTRNRQKNK